MIKTLVVEDHKLVAQGLQVMLSFANEVTLVGVVSSGEQAIEKVKEQEIDVILMDVNLGGGISGIEATKRIKASSPETKVLILTMFTDPGTVAEAIKAGANGYLSKGSSREEVLQAIEDVAEERSVLDPAVTDAVFNKMGRPGPRTLSDRELTVLQELADGKSTREVAQSIHVAEETVKTYLKQIFKKLQVRDRTEAVAEALRRGLVH